MPPEPEYMDKYIESLILFAPIVQETRTLIDDLSTREVKKEVKKRVRDPNMPKKPC